MPTWLSLVTGDTAGCHNENLWCPKWWLNWHYDNSWLLVSYNVNMLSCPSYLYNQNLYNPYDGFCIEMDCFCFISGEEAHSVRDNMASCWCHRPTWRQVKQCFDKMATNKSISLSLIIYTTDYRESFLKFSFFLSMGLYNKIVNSPKWYFMDMQNQNNCNFSITICCVG